MTAATAEALARILARWGVGISGELLAAGGAEVVVTAFGRRFLCTVVEVQ